jgi:Leucine rich repeat
MGSSGRVLIAIQELNVSQNKLRVLPSSVCKLMSLQVLVVDGNALTSLPQDLGRLPALRRLRARSNQLQSLPDSLCHAKLAVLNVAGNKLASVPDWMQDLAGVWRRERAQPSACNTLACTSILTDESKGRMALALLIAQRAKQISWTAGLEDLDWSKNGLDKFSPCILAELSRLTALQLSGNQLSALETGEGQMHAGLTPLEALALSTGGTCGDCNMLCQVTFPELEGGASGAAGKCLCLVLAECRASLPSAARVHDLFGPECLCCGTTVEASFAALHNVAISIVCACSAM